MQISLLVAKGYQSIKNNIRLPTLLNCRSNKSYCLDNSSEEISFFSLKGKVFQAKITSIQSLTDFNACLEYNGNLTKFAVRLYGIEKNIDPEIGNNLSTFIPNTMLVYLVAHDFDQDGRLLVKLYNNEHLYKIGDMSINEHILLTINMDGNLENNPLFELEF